MRLPIGTVRRAALALLSGSLTLCAAGSSQAHALYVASGEGDDSRQAAVGIQWDRGDPIHRLGDGAALTGHLRLSIGEIVGLRQAIPHNAIRTIAITPLLRLQMPWWSSRSYVESGVGVGLLSETTLNGDRRLSTPFQFTEFLGAGFRFGARRQYEVGAQVQHVSNGGIKEPNSGISFVIGRFAWYWR